MHATRRTFAVQMTLLGFALLAQTSAVALAQTLPARCTALVQAQNDLWLVRSDGSAIVQLTNDKIVKLAAARSPDGQWIAYSSEQRPRTVTVLDANGAYVATIAINAQDVVTRMDWISPTLLRLQEHVSPTTSRFHFVQFPLNAAAAVEIGQRVPARGSSCALSPKKKTLACIEGDTITIQNRTAYYAPSPFIGAHVLQTFELTQGRSVTTSTTPPITVALKSIGRDTVELKFSTPDNLWQTEYLRLGDSTPLPLGQDAAAAAPVALLGVRATMSARKTGVVRIDLLQARSGKIALEGDVVWDPRGKRVAAIEVNGNDERALLLVNRQRADDDDQGSERDAVSTDNGKLALPIQGPIRSLAFTSATHLRVVGESQAVEFDIPANGTVLAAVNPIVSEAPSASLTVTLGTVPMTLPVIDWNCRE